MIIYQQFNEGSQLEGFERVSIVIEILSSRLGDAWFEEGEVCTEDLHPAIYDQKAAELLAKATEALADLYQHIDQWDL